VSPQRIQRTRRAGWRMPPGAVYVGRPSYWGNPFVVAPGPVIPPVRARMWDVRIEGELLCRWDTRALALADAANRFRDYLAERREGRHQRSLGYPWESQIRAELAGKDLACWCGIGLPCHGDWLLTVANQPAEGNAE